MNATFVPTMNQSPRSGSSESRPQVLAIACGAPSGSSGGAYRAEQIYELIRSGGFELILKPDVEPVPRFQAYAEGVKFALQSRSRVRFSHRLIGYSGQECAWYKRVLAEYPAASVVLWEKTASPVAPYLAGAAGRSVIAVPHNLEAFVSSSDWYSGADFPASLGEEIRHLGAASNVFAISREEQWVMSASGISADFLPYYPPASVRERCARVRASRRESVKSNFLIMGSAIYPPILEGMKELLGGLIRERPDLFVDVVGQGTEELAGLFPGRNIRFHGRLSDAAMEKTLTQARALLILQRKGGGALTRIPEMLLAGIPVIANGVACRSALAYSGVYPYDSDEELYGLLDAHHDIPVLPARPEIAETRFLQALSAPSRRKIASR